MTSDDLIQTVTQMIHEDSLNAIGHQSKLQRLQNLSTKLGHKINKGKSSDPIELKKKAVISSRAEATDKSSDRGSV